MWMMFFIFALIGVLVLLVYLLIELNDLEKKISEIAEEIKIHYDKN